jgi:endonuclease/exonuclease/phosphatase (EEP) superfamily protein YafD
LRKLFRTIMIVFNIIAAVSLMMACLCCFVSPKTIWWISFFGLAYIYLLAANLCLITFWALSRKKKLVVISLVSILIGGPFIGRQVQLFAKETPEKEVDKSFRVLSFNVQGFMQRNTEQTGGKMLNIFDFIREKDAAIICVQEYMTGPLGKGSDFRKQFGATPFCHMELPGGNFGIATFSKYPIIRKQIVYADNSTNACMCSDLQIGKDTVRVYNVHLKSVGFNDKEKHLLHNAVKRDYSESDVRTAQAIIRQMKVSSFSRAKQVEILSAHIAQSPYPVIICGDFNDPPTSHSYQKVRGSRKDAFIASGKGRSTTYNIGRISSQRIDYILYSDVFKAYDYESPRVRLSDHFPITCRLVKQE